jgi:hypothetical protein
MFSEECPHTTHSTHFWTAVCGGKYKGVSSFYKKFSVKTIIKKRKTVWPLSLIAHHTHYPIMTSARKERFRSLKSPKQALLKVDKL